MAPTECPRCKNVAPARSRFCNACGAPLGMTPCTHCGAINGAEALACFMCGAALAPRTSDANASLVPDAEPSGSLPEPEANVADVSPDPIMAIEASWVHHEAVSDEPPNDGLGPDQPVPPIPEISQAIGHAADALPANTEPEPVDVSAPTDAPGSPLPSRRPLFLAAASAAVVAAALYVALGPKPRVETSPPLSANRATGKLENVNEPRGAGKNESGTVDPKPPASVAAPAEPSSAGVAAQAVPALAQSEDAVQASPAAPPATAAPATPKPRGAPRERATVLREPTPTAEVLARPKAIERAPAPQPSPAGLGPCTEAVAALGLCTNESTQRRP